MRCLGRIFVVGCLAVGLMACGGDDDDGGSGTAATSLSQCAVDKLDALADYCRAYLRSGASAGDITAARTDLVAAWRAAEAVPAAEGLGCTDLALTTDQATAIIDDTVASLESAVGGGPNGSDCAGDFFDAVGAMCETSLEAEAGYYADQGSGSAQGRRLEQRESARRTFLPDADAALRDGCFDSEDEVRMVSNMGRVETDDLVDQLSFDVVAAANVDDTQYITISPTGTIEYEGEALTPICMDSSDYHFFARRGTVNKLVVYYQGGGACWEKLTCGVATCDTNVDPDRDNPNNVSTGFADRNNPDNPFRDWHTVFISYCGCDIHFGDAAQDYVDGPDDTEPLHVEHRGYQNARVVEKWAREHFLAPDEIFVTGSSAGAYGAWFHGPLLQWGWPGAQFHILADAGNGVITQSFLDESFPNWNFEANLPDEIPEIGEELAAGSGIPGYTKVVAREFPDTNWAHYSTAFDGGTGGQTGFYNIMLNDNEPIAALTWWDASCAFTDQMRAQSIDISDEISRNYRYYIGTGARHTMWGSNKVYGIEDPGAPEGEEKITTDTNIVDWVNAMLNSRPGDVDDAWVNHDCEDCGLVLPDDPRPDPLQTPFEDVDGDDRIVCE